jgi:hypothetical protein
LGCWLVVVVVAAAAPVFVGGGSVLGVCSRLCFGEVDVFLALGADAFNLRLAREGNKRLPPLLLGRGETAERAAAADVEGRLLFLVVAGEVRGVCFFASFDGVCLGGLPNLERFAAGLETFSVSGDS